MDITIYDERGIKTHYAVIEAGLVSNVIVCDQAFADMIAKPEKKVLPIDHLYPKPKIGWKYSEEKGFEE